MLVNQLTIVGLGLIGGSLAKACRAKGLMRYMVGVDQDPATLEQARDIVDLATASLAKGIADSDLVMVATPPASILPVIKEMSLYLKKGAMISDVGSVKAPIVAEAMELLSPDNPFVGGHPIAGTEKAGFGASFAELFQGQLCILTPTAKTDDSAFRRVKELWEHLGSRVAIMEPQEHDRIFALVSHLPHLVAYALVTMVGQCQAAGGNIFAYSGGGLRDFTRLAASHPVMWRDICLLNDKYLLETLDSFQLALEDIRLGLERKDGQALQTLFEKAREINARMGIKARMR